jgi:hypothetical protein
MYRYISTSLSNITSSVAYADRLKTDKINSNHESHLGYRLIGIIIFRNGHRV